MGDARETRIKCDTLIGSRPLHVEINAFVRQRYLGQGRKAVYLVRPDQVIAGRWLRTSDDELRSAIKEVYEGKR